ncbi:MAG: glycoside hydrolase family 2 protein [Ferruginibacter sp.]|nr:glycoside hydrolase family 2 protein [Ferruginibacter sp.]
MKKHPLLTAILIANFCSLFSQSPIGNSLREHLPMDAGWRFAFGHPSDTKKDFNNGTGYFSYLTKAGFGDGAAASNFDDRTWRKLDLPHDWAVEQPFSEQGSFSHGFKAIGRNFPDASIGWYRKTFLVPATDLGRRISIAFDGVYRNSIVWVNGHYLGLHPGGYLGFEYDISAYLNYGGENTIAVRADATMEEGWFYEGAGIYRHVWLNKTNALHVATNGTYVTTKPADQSTTVQIATTINNDAITTNGFTISQTIADEKGKTVATKNIQQLSLPAMNNKTFSCNINITNPTLWSIENPYLYSLTTVVQQDGKTVDTYNTVFGIRTIRFDKNEGFFLNGKHVKIMGTNNHQDHGGVGSAMPDALQDFRIKTLKSFGSNAYRCSHNPPTPELLDACDRLGMLVIDENRLTGITQTHLEDVKRLIERDRNHPSIISWSIGNEEWGIENSVIGARIATTMQAFVKSMDSTRPATYAFSGGIGSKGITTVMELLGINYVINKSTDEQHKLFPEQALWGTEEGSTHATRGAYFRDDAKHIIPAYDKPPSKSFLSIEQGWKHYANRPYLAGMFIWTGFDYRGEPTPYGWPSINSYFGMVDLCGFPKDDTWYLKSWWTKETTLHILPHWNWAGKEGQPIEVWAYSNCDEVELFLNKKSQGKKKMELNSHLEWMVNYAPGTLEAVGYKNGKKIITDKVNTTKEAVAINMVSDRNVIAGNSTDVAIIAVEVKDKNGLHEPTADHEITFSVQGPGKIIAVGNGNPTSLEPDKYLEGIKVIKIENLKEKAVDNINSHAEAAADYNDADWKRAFTDERNEQFSKEVKALAYRGSFVLPALTGREVITFFYNCIGVEQTLFINGKQIAANIKEADKNGYLLDASGLREGANSVAIFATPIIKKQSWDNINTNTGQLQVLTPAPVYKRKLFNGLAQVIVQSTGEEGDIILTGTGKGLQPFSLKIEAKKIKN